jgi:hypothetical protein
MTKPKIEVPRKMNDSGQWAIDKDGTPLPFSPEEVRATVNKALHEGRVLAVVIKMKDGSLAVPVIGDPNPLIGEALLIAGQAYKTALKGKH